MKLYVVESFTGVTLGAFTTLKEAVTRGWETVNDEFEIYAIDVDVTAENIRRLVGNVGAYANGESVYYDNRGRRLPEGELSEKQLQVGAL